MTAASGFLADIRAALYPHGIFMRGVVSFDGEERPELAGGGRASSVVLLGNIGGSIWEPFRNWRARPENSGRCHPLDDWSKDMIRPIADRLRATAYFPSDPPWQPFQRWAMQAEGLRTSPLGILVHPEYGLWHGYRGALGFAESIEPDEKGEGSVHPCDRCPDKPCLSACPVEAVGGDRFDVAACRKHLLTAPVQPACVQIGCLARNACPVGARYRYGDGQLRFHMESLRSVP